MWFALPFWSGRVPFFEVSAALKYMASQASPLFPSNLACSLQTQGFATHISSQATDTLNLRSLPYTA